MPLLSLAIPNLLNGISQQPAQLRFPTQGELQENGYSSIVEGLVKRPPTEHVAQIITNATGNCKVHAIDRDATEQYIVVVRDNDLKVFNKNGVAQTVNYQDSDAQAYINITDGSDPNQVFKLLTIADYTFIVNSQKTVEMGTTKSPKNNPEHQALVWLGQAVAGINNRIVLKGTNSGATEVIAEEKFTQTVGQATGDTVAGVLTTEINAGSAQGFSASQTGNVIKITRTLSGASADFTVTVWDGNGGNILKLVKDVVDDIEDLPKVAPNGFITKVRGDLEDSADDFWVKFVNDHGGTIVGTGIWRETLAKDIPYQFNATTMPHVLVRDSINSEGVATFTLKRATWADRKVGDETTNANPSFVGGQIADVFLFRGRLGFLSGENVILSESGEYFNFWRTTVTSLLDSDPIDVASSYPEITLFKHAVPYDDRLIIFSDRAQFLLTAPNILTPTTVLMRVAGTYDALPNCAPTLVGEEVFFAFDRGGYTGVREIIANFEDTQSLTSPDISANIPKYIPGKLMALKGTSHDNVVVGFSEADPSALYLYKWFDNARERVQASWSKWTFAGVKIRGVTWLDDTLYLATERPGGLYLERITVKPNRSDESSAYVVTLDRRVGRDSASMTYDANTDRTTITLPYTIHNASAMRVVSQAMAGATSYDFGSFASGLSTVVDLGSFTNLAQIYLDYNSTAPAEAGISYTILTATDGASTIVVRGNLLDRKVWVGETYTFKYRLSTPYLRRQGERGTEVYSTGRFQVRNVFLTYVKSAYFKVQVADKYGATSFDMVYSGNLLGTGQAILNAIPIEDGVYQVPVLMKNEDMVMDIISDSHLPVGFTAATIEASYDTRAARR